MSSDNKKSSNIRNDIEKKESFFEKMRNDKRYNAKVQLIGYGILIGALIIYLNLSNLVSGGSNSNLSLDDFNENLINNSGESTEVNKNLLKSLADNYVYDIVVEVDKKSINTETNEEVDVSHSINYRGKSYGNKLEINKTVTEVTDLYYKVDDNYYSMVNNMTSSVHKEVIYDIVEGSYIELKGILDIINKSSLDHVTDYSSGKVVSVYHYEVLSPMSNNREPEVVEINVTEENGILKIEIDYDNLFKEKDTGISGCELVATITNIGLVDDFEVVVGELENTSKE